MNMLSKLMRVLCITFLGLHLAACAESLENQILDELEQESSDASDDSPATAPGETDNSGDSDEPSDIGDSSDTTDNPDSTESDPDEIEEETQESKITNYPQEGDVILTLANATNHDEWVYFDFETQSQVEPSKPVDSEQWDIAFKRYRVKLNGGYHGTGEVIVSVIEDEVLANVTEAPREPWQSDTADVDDDGDEFPEEPVSKWYQYDGTTHVLTAYEIVYAIRTVEGSFYKFEFAGYYSQEGTSGHPSIRWAVLPEPIEEIVEPEFEEPGDVIEDDET